MKDIVTIQNVRGYCDENGTAWLNAEDVARGLGFVEANKFSTSGENYVRWERVNGYLHGFGFVPTRGDDVKAGDYIPENMFYRLAMKANNAVAEAFQAKIADEILPTIRKTGSYSINQKRSSPLCEAVCDIEFLTGKIQNLFAVQRGIALSQAITFVEDNTKLKLDTLKQLLPPAEHETGYLNPTQIGERLGGLPARVVNKLLANAGLQYKDGKYWRLTEAGKAYGEEMPFTRNGHSGYQICWNEDVVVMLRSA